MTAGTANTGGGGGAACSNFATPGGAGGSGKVIVRYETALLTATGGTITTDGAYTVHSFTSSGTFEVTAVTLPPVTDFSATPTSGTAPFNAPFTDLSTNNPTSWAWTFGDGNTSTSQNPSNNYLAAGTYTVGLTATNAAGSDLETKTNYITVTGGTTTTKTGGKGDNTFKPTGLDHPRPKLKAKDPSVQKRLDDSARIQEEVAAELAKELGETQDSKPVERMSQAQIDAEIKDLLHRKIRTENEEIMLLLLMAASA